MRLKRLSYIKETFLIAPIRLLYFTRQSQSRIANIFNRCIGPLLFLERGLHHRLHKNPKQIYRQPDMDQTGLRFRI